MNNKEFSCTSQKEVASMRALWRAVIMQAFQDALSNAKNYDLRREKIKAVSWLSSDNEDLKIVCSYADLDYHYVKKKVKELVLHSKPPDGPSRGRISHRIHGEHVHKRKEL